MKKHLKLVTGEDSALSTSRQAELDTEVDAEWERVEAIHEEWLESGGDLSDLINEDQIVFGN